jgi:subtilase family serine protease
VINSGAGNAEAFNIQIVLDPEQSVIVDQRTTGLGPGQEESFTITTPPGGNCYDPNCTICVTVDSYQQVTESNKENNRLCMTAGG